MKLGASFVSVEGATAIGEGLVELHVISPVLEEGDVQVEVYTAAVPQLKAVSSELVAFNLAVPHIDKPPDPSFGPTTGGTAVYVEVEAFPVVDVPNDVGVECAGKEGSVDTLLESNDERLRVSLRVPAVTEAGGTVCVIYPMDDRENRAEFGFEYQPPRALRFDSFVPTSAYVTGGTLLRIVIANFPTIGVDGVEAVIVRFGPGAVGIEVQPSKILSSNEEQTTFVVSAPPMKQPGTVSVSVSVANDPSRIVSSQLRYKARPKPRVTTLIPTRASRLGGDYVSVSLENFPVVASTKEVRVLFGNSEADVTEISVSDVSATVLVVTVPSSDIDGEVLISVSHRKDRTLGAGSAKFTLLGTDPRLAYVYPTEAPVTGGKQVSVRLENILRTYTVSDILVWVAGIRAEVRTVSSTKEKAMNIRFVSPEISNVGVFGHPYLHSGQLKEH